MACCACLLFAAPAMRALDLTAEVGVQGEYVGQSCSQSGSAQSGTASANCTAQAAGLIDPPNPDTATFGGSGSAQARYGILHSFASALAACNVVTGGVSCGINGTAVGESIFSDVITITGAPTSGYLDFAVRVDGTATVTCVAPSAPLCAGDYASTDLTVAGDGITPEQTFELSSGLSLPNVDLAFDSTGGFAAVYVEMNLTASVGCQASNDASCNAINNFSNTALVTGLSVFNAQGRLVSGAGLSSESGTNYNDIGETSGVPEPSFVILAALGTSRLTVCHRLG